MLRHEIQSEKNVDMNTLSKLPGCLNRVLVISLAVFACTSTLARAAETVDISNATVVVRNGKLASAESAASTVLIEEIQRRAGLQLKTSKNWPKAQPVIAITTAKSRPWGRSVPPSATSDHPERRKDGFRLVVDNSNTQAPVVWVVGADARGTLYGVGALLRNLSCSTGQASLPASLDIATAPMYPIRGHQLGFRTAANSWDMWTAEQFDQYIRELTFFGINAIENIPFQDDRPIPSMKLSRREMNKQMSAICYRYGLDYWVWTPADFDLKDAAKRDAHLEQHEEFYRDCKTLSAIFFPGGDPGNNPPELVMPLLEDLAKLVKPIHPKAKIYLSLQGFHGEEVDYVFDYINKHNPTWLGGLCEGPSSPPIAYLRGRLPRQYQLRMYPDITHNKLSQYEVPWWDQTHALTLGREAINPRPAQYAYIHNWFAPYCDGFISYSDGVHDDVNKTVWSALSWDTSTPVRDIMIEYSRVFFGSNVAEGAADGIFALEKNWRGPLVENGAVEGTLLQWQGLENKAPELKSNWRWQMCLVRAYYDAYNRRRLISETELENKANSVLLRAAKLGSDKAMAEATAILNHAVTHPISPEIKTRIEQLFDDLFHSIQLQSSVPKYQASGAERGASLDFIDIPLNNRWWLEDEFKKVAEMKTENEKVERLIAIANWENPGPGGHYDNVGNTAKSQHVLHSDVTFTQPAEGANPSPTHWWWDEGKSRKRLTWQISMDWPKAMVYEGLNPNASYIVRTTGYGKTPLKMDGTRITPTKDAKEIGDLREFAVPKDALADGKLELTFDRPTDEARLNWRQQSRLSEVWVIKVATK
jgi:hypothetical protein